MRPDVMSCQTWTNRIAEVELDFEVAQLRDNLSQRHLANYEDLAALQRYLTWLKLKRDQAEAREALQKPVAKKEDYF